MANRQEAAVPKEFLIWTVALDQKHQVFKCHSEQKYHKKEKKRKIMTE